MIRSPLRSNQLLIKSLIKSDHPSESNSRPIRLQSNRTWSVLVGREFGWNGTSVVNSNWSGRTRKPIRRWYDLGRSLIKCYRNWMETRLDVTWSEWRSDQKWLYLVGEPIKVIGLECRSDQSDLKIVEIRSVGDWSGVETRSKVIGPEWRPDQRWFDLSQDLIRGDRN